MKKAQPDVEFVTEQATPLGKIDAGAVAQAIDDAKPDAIFNVLFGGDLAKFVREGNTRGVFKNRTVVSLLSGEPEYLDPLKDEAPVGWIVTGYPWNKIKTPEHFAFLNAYQHEIQNLSAARLGGRLRDDQVGGGGRHRQGQVDRYGKAGRPRSRDLYVASPFGAFYYRAIDHQATMGCLCRQDRAGERQGHHGRLQICRRRLGDAARCRGEEAAAGDGLKRCPRSLSLSPCGRGWRVRSDSEPSRVRGCPDRSTPHPPRSLRSLGTLSHKGRGEESCGAAV